jgi:hypothetical protein
MTDCLLRVPSGKHGGPPLPTPRPIFWRAARVGWRPLPLGAAPSPFLHVKGLIAKLEWIQMEKMEKQPIPATKRKRATANNLTVTSPGQAALSLELAAKSGDYLTTLIALRDVLAAQFDRCRNKRVAAALSARIADVVSRIEQEERLQRGQRSGQVPSNESVRRSLDETVARGGGVSDRLL